MHLTKILKEGLCINTEAWQGTFFVAKPNILPAFEVPTSTSLL